MTPLCRDYLSWRKQSILFCVWGPASDGRESGILFSCLPRHCCQSSGRGESDPMLHMWPGFGPKPLLFSSIGPGAMGQVCQSCVCLRSPHKPCCHSLDRFPPRCVRNWRLLTAQTCLLPAPSLPCLDVALARPKTLARNTDRVISVNFSPFHPRLSQLWNQPPLRTAPRRSLS